MKFATAAQELVKISHFLYGKGWSPATSSNYSLRLKDGSVAITSSGKHKGDLQVADIVRVDLAGKSYDPELKPSAETLLHTRLYQRFPETKAVLHTHSVAATVMSIHRRDAQEIRFHDYELQKGFARVASHQTPLSIPIFDNDQDIAALAERVDAFLAESPNTPGYIIRGHGIYTWGNSLSEAKRHVETFEFLLACELELMRLAR